MVKTVLLVVPLLACFAQINSVLNPKVVCYYDYWFVWHTGNDKMTVDDIDSSLCTHLVYSTLDVDYEGRISLRGDDYLLIEQKDLLHFSEKKGQAKAMIDMLGNNLPAIARDATRRSAFVMNLVEFFKAYNFDGVVLNIVPNFNNNDLIDLLKLFPNTFGDKYVLGISVGSQPGTLKVDQVNRYVNFISVQTYDYHGSWERIGSDQHLVVGNGAPLDLQLKSLSAWEKAGAQANKLLMGIPLFGHTWYLAGSDSEPGARAKAPGPKDGIISYKELCSEMLAEQSSWEVHNKPDQAVIYAVNKRNSLWVSFESSITTEAKTNKATSLGYGGVVAVRLENDDYRGLCGQKYALLRGINKGLNKDDVIRTTTTHAPPTTPLPVTPDPNKICQKTGIVRDPKDCNIYHKCTEIMPGILSDDIEHCSKGEAFDPKDNQCKDKALVPGC